MTLLIAFVSNLFAQFLKNFVYKKWGDYGIYTVVFIVALGGTIIYKYVYAIPEWKEIITQALETLAYAIALYELILKRVGFSGANDEA